MITNEEENKKFVKIREIRGKKSYCAGEIFP